MLPQGSQGSEDYRLARLQYSHGGSRFPRHMQHHQNLGQDIARHVKPLVLLTKKDMEFVWGMDQKASMEDLKQAIVMAPCLRLINYHTDRCVILAIDLSCIATSLES